MLEAEANWICPVVAAGEMRLAGRMICFLQARGFCRVAVMAIRPAGVSAKLNWFKAHPRTVLCALLVGCLGPFLDKAVSVDDPLFVWSAQWIQKHPLDFYSFGTNWWMSTVPMYVANWNPPLMSYCLAVAGLFCGWEERGLHLAGLVIACGTAAGIYSLAQRWCGRPFWAVCLAIFTPVFLVSGSTLMCDVLMLGFWVWAVWFWEQGWQKPGGGAKWFIGAGLLAGLAVLTKFSAVLLPPLLLVMAIFRTRRPGWWLAGLAIPTLMLAGYELFTAHLYGKGLFSAASYHAHTFRTDPPGGWKAAAIISLTFAGGSLLPVLFMAPAIWRGRVLAGEGILLGVAWAGFYQWGDGLGLAANAPGLMRHAGMAFQTALLAVGGLNLAGLLVAEGWRAKDAVTRSLLVWIAGVLVFATVLNWTINARSFLPLVPAVAILLSRRLEARPGAWSAPGRIFWPLIPAAAVSVSLVVADYGLAGTGRSAAAMIADECQKEGAPVWFEGHGGFQYYLEKRGGRPLDVERTLMARGDFLVVPDTGVSVTFPPDTIGFVGNLKLTPTAWMNLAGGSPASGMAGFYGDNAGPLPFVWAEPLPQSYALFRVFCRQQFNSRPTYTPAMRAVDVPGYPDISADTEENPSPALHPAAQEDLQVAVKLAQQGDTAAAISHYQTLIETFTNDPVLLNNYAWVLMTARPVAWRNPVKAARLAEQAVILTDSRQPAFLGTYAAACAAAGDFPTAVSMAEAAEILAKTCNQRDYAVQNAALRRLYEQGRTAETLVSP